MRVFQTAVDTIGPRLVLMAGAAHGHAMSAMEMGAVQVEQYAQASAPWSDQTGEARAGLTAEVYEEAGQIVLELYHQAEHGYWLELIQDGRFAVIMPTLERFAPEILRAGGAAVVSFDGGE